MIIPSNSDSSMFPNVDHMEQALAKLKQGVATHIECESRLYRLFATCHERWLSQFEQLRKRLDSLELRLASRMTERDEGPRLAVVPPNEDAA